MRRGERERGEGVWGEGKGRGGRGYGERGGYGTNSLTTAVHDIQPFGTKKFNMTHSVHHLSFGEDYPGQRHPLDGYTQVASEDPTTGEQ